MTTKQILLLTLIFGAASNTGLAMDTTNATPPEQKEKKEYNSTTYYTESPDGSTVCTIHEDHIVFATDFKKQEDGSCWLSGPLMFETINTALRNQSELPMDMEQFSLTNKIGKSTSSDCRCNTLLVLMRKQGNSKKLHKLFNQAAKNTIIH